MSGFRSLAYPMRGASPVPVEELGYLLYPTKRENNHHSYWYASTCAKFVITQTLRDLDRHQTIMPITQHNQLHADYEPPELPTVHQALEVIDDAYQQGELLRYGSAHHPTYRPITAQLMQTLGFEYGALV